MTDGRHGIGGNVPPTDEHAMTERLRETHPEIVDRNRELRAAFGRMPSAILDAETAKRAGDFIKQLRAHLSTADTARKAAKEPYLAGGRIIDGFFHTELIRPIEAEKNEVSIRLTAWQTAEAERERREREEAARLAREAAERLAREAAERLAREREEAAERAREDREKAERLAREAEMAARGCETEEELAAALAAEERAQQAAAEAARREAEERVEAARREAEEREQAQMAAARAAAREREAAAPVADLSRQRSMAGTTASLRTTVACLGFNRADLDLEPLRPYIPNAALETAIRAFIRAGGRQLAGATIEEVQRSVVR